MHSTIALSKVHYTIALFKVHSTIAFSKVHYSIALSKIHSTVHNLVQNGLTRQKMALCVLQCAKYEMCKDAQAG